MVNDQWDDNAAVEEGKVLVLSYIMSMSEARKCLAFTIIHKSYNIYIILFVCYNV